LVLLIIVVILNRHPILGFSECTRERARKRARKRAEDACGFRSSSLGTLAIYHRVEFLRRADYLFGRNAKTIQDNILVFARRWVFIDLILNNLQILRKKTIIYGIIVFLDLLSCRGLRIY